MTCESLETTRSFDNNVLSVVPWVIHGLDLQAPKFKTLLSMNITISISWLPQKAAHMTKLHLSSPSESRYLNDYSGSLVTWRLQARSLSGDSEMVYLRFELEESPTSTDCCFLLAYGKQSRFSMYGWLKLKRVFCSFALYMDITLKSIPNSILFLPV